MKKVFFLLPLFLFADVDPFKAGDLNSPTPYGLTPTEKAILKNKKEISKNKNEILKLKKEIQKLKEDLAAKSVMYESMLDDLKDKTSSIPTLINEIGALNEDIVLLKKRVKNLENNLSIINQRVENLEANLSLINKKYDSLKENLKEIVKLQNENFKYLSDSLQKLIKEVKNKNISPKEAFKKAKQFYFNNKLDKAKELFLVSLNHNYLPATSSFYLGEIAYKNGNYKEALAFYKKSVTLYPKKTSFTALLLYHTGKSFEKLGMKDEAKEAFKKLIANFKNSKYAKLAKKELEKLK